MDEPTTSNVISNMSSFSYDELHRLVDLIPQTDPRTPQYGILLESIERYGAAMGNVELIIQLPDPRVTPKVIAFSPPTGEADKFEEQIYEGQASTEKIAAVGVTYDDLSYDSAEVKSLITKARAEKKITSVKSWIQENWGVDGFTAIPAGKYPEVMAKLAELGVS